VVKGKVSSEYSRHEYDEDIEPDSNVGQEAQSLKRPNLSKQEPQEHEDDFGNDDWKRKSASVRSTFRYKTASVQHKKPVPLAPAAICCNPCPLLTIRSVTFMKNWQLWSTLMPRRAQLPKIR
jgi:hypothetical protein